MASRTKQLQRTVQKLLDKVAELLRQPLSDESYEVPRAKTVRRSKAVARRGSTRKRKATKAKRRSRKG